MKSVVLGVLTLVVAGGILATPKTSEPKVEVKAEVTQSYAQQCNQGLVVRPDGSIVIDQWRSFDPPVDGKVPFPNTGRVQPYAVHLGHTLSDDLRVCFESEEADGSTCYPLFKLRKMVNPDVITTPKVPIKK